MGLFDAIMTWYALQQSQKKPNTEVAPATPGEQFLLDTFQKYANNPSPQRQAAQSYYTQMMQGMNGMNANGFSFISPMLKGQQFSGGAHLPTFDTSKFALGTQSPGGTPSTSHTPTTGAGPAQSGPTYGENPDGLPDMPYGSNGQPADIGAWIANNPAKVNALLRYGADLPKWLADYLANPASQPSLTTNPNQYSNGNPIGSGDLAPSGWTPPHSTQLPDQGNNQLYQDQWNWADLWNNGLANGGPMGAGGGSGAMPPGYGTVPNTLAPRR